MCRERGPIPCPDAERLWEGRMASLRRLRGADHGIPRLGCLWQSATSRLLPEHIPSMLARWGPLCAVCRHVGSVRRATRDDRTGGEASLDRISHYPTANAGSRTSGQRSRRCGKSVKIVRNLHTYRQYGDLQLTDSANGPRQRLSQKSHPQKPQVRPAPVPGRVHRQ